MMGTPKRLLIKGILFLTIFWGVLAFLDFVFLPKTGTIGQQSLSTNAFYQLPRNSIDVIYIGASTFYKGISPLGVFKAYGITGFVRASPAQMPLVSYYVFLETLQYQNPKLVVLDASLLLKDLSKLDEKEQWLHVAVDPLRLSSAKFKMILEINKQSEEQNVLSYLLPFFRYHSRWDQLTWQDFQASKKNLITDSFKGFRPTTVIDNEGETDPFVDSPGTQKQLSQLAIAYYSQIIKICRERSIDLILFSTPRRVWSESEHDLLQSFADSQHIPYLDFSTPRNIEILGIDKNSDFLDSNHLSIYGGIKVTRELGRYIHSNYSIPNKKKNPDYDQWNQDLRIYNNWIKNNAPEISGVQ